MLDLERNKIFPALQTELGPAAQQSYVIVLAQCRLKVATPYPSLRVAKSAAEGLA